LLLLACRHLALRICVGSCGKQAYVHKACQILQLVLTRPGDEPVLTCWQHFGKDHTGSCDGVKNFAAFGLDASAGALQTVGSPGEDRSIAIRRRHVGEAGFRMFNVEQVRVSSAATLQQ
jgi:hypothetical protein